MKPSHAPVAAPAMEKHSQIQREIHDLLKETVAGLIRSCECALLIGLRLLVLHRQTGDSETPGGFRAALESLTGKSVTRPTAYRWINAAAAVLARHQGLDDDAQKLKLPDHPGSLCWTAAEKVLSQAAQGMSLRRLIVGHAAVGEESRMDTLITRAESGDTLAENALSDVAAGRLTLVQAIRSLAGQTATKDKNRADPVYLDIDSVSGQPVGLVPKCLVTMANAFARWDTFDPSARQSIRSSWKALVSNMPKDLR